MNDMTKGDIIGTRYFKRDQITKSYQPGRYITMAITYKFLIYTLRDKNGKNN